MKTLKQLREENAAKIEEMNALVQKAESEKRDLSAEEQATFDALHAEHEELAKEILSRSGSEARKATAATLKKGLEETAGSAARGGKVEPRAGSNEPGGDFTSLGDFFHSVAYRRESDPRLASLWKEPAHGGDVRAEMRTDTGGTGGFMIPKQFRDDLLKVDDDDEVIMRPRATVIPAGNPPDAEVTMPALDQNTTNRNGGVQMKWIGEGGTKPETNAAFREVSLKPYEVAASLVVTDKLLRNFSAASTLIPTLLNREMNQEEDYQFMRGDGIAKPLGWMNAGNGSLIKVNRATANKVKYVDLTVMKKKLKGTRGIWTITKDAMDVVMQMEDSEGHLIWVPSAREGEPPNLLGLPVFFTEKQPALGSLCDVALSDPKAYIIKDGSGPFVDVSTHVKFLDNKTVFKITWNVDGQPWAKAPIKGRDGLYYSPFIGLDIPAA